MVCYLKKTHFVAKNTLKLDIVINICLINVNVILYYAFSLNIYEKKKRS